MTKTTEIYKCSVCGNVVEVLHGSFGELVCCSQPMLHLKENTNDSASQEKHVPVKDGDFVKVGSVAHPMEEKHYIQFIEVISPDKKYIARKYLSPNEEPSMNIDYDYSKDAFTMRELCNLHGLWSNEVKNI